MKLSQNEYQLRSMREVIYLLPRLITNNNYMRSFQYKILNNVPFLNKKLYTFGIKPAPLCFLCVLCDETTIHIRYECDHVKCLWSELVQCFQNSLILPTLMLFLGFLILHTITIISKTIKFLSVTFYWYLI